MAAAAAIIAVVVVSNDDDSGELVPATEVPLPDPSLPATPTTDPVETTPTTAAAATEDMALIAELNGELGVTMLLATHAADVAGAASRILKMRDGRFA